MKLAILISGSGSNLQAFIDAAADSSLPADIEVVISNKPDVKGLSRAEQAGIATRVIPHQNFSSRELFDQALIDCIDDFNVDAVVLAGFMRILSAELVNHYLGRLFNIHPSLLPKYPGLHTHQRAIDSGDTEAGATVHFVVPELDAGPAILQASVPVESTDTAEDLAARVLQQEHKIYPLAVKWFCEKKLQLRDNRAVLNEKELPENGLAFSESLLENS